MTRPHEDTLLYLDGVTVTFDGFRALNALSLVMERCSTGSATGQTATLPLRRAQPGHRRVSPSCH